jgi:hypothetical protein
VQSLIAKWQKCPLETPGEPETRVLQLAQASYDQLMNRKLIKTDKKHVLDISTHAK